ncbi:uncharacterized protein LOC126677152 [Mercurialis annua]|uniref:uncharacterized protein LOC126677152 n=1 Tax=Mercurialis annua TaxID=3986 RepID=UPI0021601BAF|nr:uncharacterized protein LOC126677152 [Mercurialis annua]
MSSLSESSRVMENTIEESFNYPSNKVRGNCKHGRLYLFTSWTKLNPGRRFLRCCKYKTVDHCGAFQWYDEEVSTEFVFKFGVLLDKIKVMTDQVDKQEVLIAEKNRQISRMEEAHNSVAQVFEKMIAERDMLLEEIRRLKTNYGGSESYGRFCKWMLLLFCIYALCLYVFSSNENQFLYLP